MFMTSYMSERLEPAVLASSWLAFEPIQKRQHLLNYPFLFRHADLVTYFRAINISRMTETYMQAKNYFARASGLDIAGTMLTGRYRDVIKDLYQSGSVPYLVLEISRENLVEDTFDQLWRRETRELTRPLKVLLGRHEGEEGADLGGVQQEFFRLVIGQCMDPAYGAFTLDSATRMQWFVPGSVVEPWKFEMIGLLFSLAVYNGITLPVTFPVAMYRKLLKRPVEELEHISDGWRDLYSGLATMSHWNEEEGLVEDVFARTYEFSIESMGEIISRDMRSSDFKTWPTLDSIAPAFGGWGPQASSENPTDAPLITGATRHQYIADYVHWLTDVSVSAQYTAFERGFKSCLHPKALSLLSPPLLQDVVEGRQTIDLVELQRITQHVSWKKEDRSPEFFWQVVGQFDDALRQRLLEFVTASGRVPVGGMEHMRFVIQKNGEYKGGMMPRLPTAYTCYSILLLPEYESSEVMDKMLRTALAYGQGFGFA